MRQDSGTEAQAFRAALKDGPVLFDGAMGTYYASVYGHGTDWCEMANLNRPEEIASIHRAYIEAGCRAIKTNTFSVSRFLSRGSRDLARRTLEAGCRIAREAVSAEIIGTASGGNGIPGTSSGGIPGGMSGTLPAWDSRRVFVFADIGPAPEELTRSSLYLPPAEIYCRQADMFLAMGCTCFLAETLSTDEGIPELARYLKERCPEAFLIVSYAVGAEGVTRAGDAAGDLIRRAAALGTVDAAGMNCVSGPEHLLQVVRGLGPVDIPLSVMPNAGYPGVAGRQTVFQGQPDYFGGKLAQIAAAGASIVGGCCGTTPDHIAAAASALRSGGAAVSVAAEDRVPQMSDPRKDRFGEKLDAGERVYAVELDPPADDDGVFFLDGAKALREAGADIVTIADCPVGRARADSSLMACMLLGEGVEPLPHMTCRDRNLNATKALLLGLSMAGVRNVLLVTGDPLPSESRDEIKTVFNFNSRKLSRYIQSLHGTALRNPFRVFGALNINARNFDAQLKAAKEKEDCGMAGFLTQPALSTEGLENLKRARDALSGKILGGVYPIVSYRNACFLNNEVAGIRVSEKIMARYEGKSREEGEDIAVELSVQMAEAMAGFTDGVYLMTPFRRVELIRRILAEIR